jgi:NAD(P)H-hydrate epimerase
MLSLDPHDEFFTLLPDITGYSALGIGPGLGKQSKTKDALEYLLQKIQIPFVIDADAINLIASDPNLPEFIPEKSIITPHPKEFDRLAGESNSSYERLHKAREFARKHTICVILKGAYTAVCTPGGNVYFNGNGNPGMATAGSGDVLTGIILGLLAQGYTPETASAAGVFIHGAAGDHAARLQSEESMIAGDIIEMLGKAFRQMK